MNKRDFYFDLPKELIAQYPLANRSDSRLLVYHRQNKRRHHQQFKDLKQFLQPGDLLVMNNSKVIPARLFGHKHSGGKVELLIERLLENNLFLAHIKASKTPKPGTFIELAKAWRLEVVNKLEDLYLCKLQGDALRMVQEIGHIPLPPYITRPDEEEDWGRYQTVYAEHQGSVAAPTAGLHFDDKMLQQLQNHGINIAYVTLHVGSGTFRPVRSEMVKDHKMHREHFILSEELCQAVAETRAQGGRVIAVGTTTLRSLESAAIDGKKLQACERETDIFIFPGFQFQICQGLLTNFHLPESTLLMLVAAFIGHKEAMALYQEAIAQGYRFFSYGDASLLL